MLCARTVLFFPLFSLVLSERRPYEEVALEGKEKVQKLLEAVNLPEVYRDYESGQPSPDTCRACISVVRLIKHHFKSEFHIKELIYWFCKQSNSENVCESLSSSYASIIFYIKLMSPLRADEVCGIILAPQCLKLESNKVFWNFEINGKPPEKHTPLKRLPREIKVLHISDVHLDPLYQPGAVADCDEPYCCRKESKNGRTKAGYWGQYWQNEPRIVCDAPQHLVEETFKNINSTKKYDYVIWTGDTTAHDDWLVKRRTVLDATSAVTKLMKNYISGSKVVFAAIGNHEGIPNYQFATIRGFKFSTRWIYQEFGKMWANWIDSSIAMEDFATGGYYARVVENALKVVVLNTNLCSRKNFWSLLQPVDPGYQLDWLTGELLHAEKLGYPVLLVGHVPPDRTCTYSWLKNYFAIVKRFKATIKATFYGHIHADEVRTYQDIESQPLPVAYIGPSLVGKNPAFRIYSLNIQGGVGDFTTYFLNLTEANQKGPSYPIAYKKLYSAKECYHLADLGPPSWREFHEKLKLNKTLLETYHNNRHRLADNVPKTCDTECKNYVLTSARQVEPI